MAQRENSVPAFVGLSTCVCNLCETYRKLHVPTAPTATAYTTRSSKFSKSITVVQNYTHIGFPQGFPAAIFVIYIFKKLLLYESNLVHPDIIS